MRDSMVFYRSFFEAVEDLDPEDFKECVTAMMRYALDGEEVKVSGVSKSVLALAKPQIDKNNQRYINGLKGGKPKTNQDDIKDKPKDNQTETKVKPKDNQTETKVKPNVNDNVNDNDIKKKNKQKEKDELIELIDAASFSEALSNKVKDWLQYKLERKEGYKPMGFKAFITQVVNHAAVYGDDAVIKLINKCMSNTWKGVQWDMLSDASPPKKQTDFNNFGYNSNYDMGAMEKALLGRGD